MSRLYFYPVFYVKAQGPSAVTMTNAPSWCAVTQCRLVQIYKILRRNLISSSFDTHSYQLPPKRLPDYSGVTSHKAAILRRPYRSYNLNHLLSRLQTPTQ
jgi:hypothetical protein